MLDFLNTKIENLTSLSLGHLELQLFDFRNKIITELETSLSLGPPELQMHVFLNITMHELNKSEPGTSRAPNLLF